MSWRDNPEIIWQDPYGHQFLMAGQHLAFVRVGQLSARDVASAPISVERRVEVTERWLAAMGLTADNIRELPRPIEAGDTVTGRIGTGHVLYRVLHIDGDDAMVRPLSGGRAISVLLADAVHADPDPDEAEPEWVVTRDPLEIAAAIDAGRTVQCQYLGGGARHGEWINTAGTAEEYRTRVETFNGAYRYEGPAIEAPVNRCTPDNRVCGNNEPSCGSPVAGYRGDGSETDLSCTRPDGHHGGCVPCGRGEAPVVHNMHLRPEDR